MAVCSTCKQEMTDPATVTCKQEVKFPDGTTMAPIPYAPSVRVRALPDGGRCHDCGISPGGFHHPGCDMELCPRCGEQLIGCGCLSEEEDEEEEEEF